MSRILTIAGIGFLLAFVGFPVQQIANGLGFLTFAVGAIATIVSATDLAKKAFGTAIVAFAVGQVFPVLHGIAWHIAPFVFVTLALGVAAHLAGVAAWRRFMDGEKEKPAKPERPKIRARADLPPTYELPPLPSADKTPFDLFRKPQRERR